MSQEVPNEADDFNMVLLNEGIELCDHGVPFDEECEDCEAGDWLVHDGDNSNA